MYVKASPGIKVPKEHKPRDYITDKDAVEVPNTPYYLRRIADKDLIEVDGKKAGKAMPAIADKTEATTGGTE